MTQQDAPAVGGELHVPATVWPMPPFVPASRSPLVTSTSIVALAEALAKAQGAFPTIGKDKTAKIETSKGSYSYSYADLADALAAVRPVLAANGLSVIQPLVHGNPTLLVTRLMHASGEWIESTFAVTVSGRPQDTGSAITYARRYAHSSLLGIAADHDDGGAAADNAAGNQKRQEPPADPQEADGDRKGRAWARSRQAIEGGVTRETAERITELLGADVKTAEGAEAVADALEHFAATGALPPDPREDGTTSPQATQAATEPGSAPSAPQSLPERVLAAAETKWKPTAADTEASGDPVQERGVLLTAAAGVINSLYDTEENIRAILGHDGKKDVAKALGAARITDLRAAVDLLEGEEQRRREAEKPF